MQVGGGGGGGGGMKVHSGIYSKLPEMVKF